MNYLSDDERQLLLNLIDDRILKIQGRVEGAKLPALTALRRKLEGVDKRVAVEETS
jgi:hypothetical protein